MRNKNVIVAGNEFVNLLALGAAIAGSALLGARDVKAAPMNWSSFIDALNQSEIR